MSEPAAASRRSVAMRGRFVLVLHSHLPWVLHHGRWPHGSSWLMEAVADCYLPLLDVFRRLARDGVPAHATIGITPVLAEMLGDPTFPGEFVGWCAERARAGEEDVATFRRKGLDRLERLAAREADAFRDAMHRFRSVHEADLLAAFRGLQDDGIVELIASAATHGYLPLLGRDECVRAQIAAGAASHVRRFGTAPRGIWLPECAFRPSGPWRRPGSGGDLVERRGVDEILREQGYRFTIVDEHLVRGGVPPGSAHARYPFSGRPIDLPRSVPVAGPGAHGLSPHELLGVAGGPGASPAEALAVFVRDAATSLKVWSADVGYPGHGAYREFHRRAPSSGHRYWRVTDRRLALGDKRPYEPEAVPPVVREHARDFVAAVAAALDRHRAEAGRPGVVVAPFDTELFGHWWHEGPGFLEQVFRELPKAGILASTGSDCLEAQPPRSVLRLPEGSWGAGGGHAVWLNERTAWMWEAIWDAEDAVLDLLRRAGTRPPWRVLPFLDQIARELLLLEASDWEFLVTTDGAADYAEARFRRHQEDLGRLLGLADRVLAGEPPGPGDPGFFTALADRDRLFRDLDLRWWSE